MYLLIQIRLQAKRVNPNCILLSRHVTIVVSYMNLILELYHSGEQ